MAGRSAVSGEGLFGFVIAHAWSIVCFMLLVSFTTNKLRNIDMQLLLTPYGAGAMPTSNVNRPSPVFSTPCR